MCLFGTCWNKNSQEFVAWALFKALHNETEQQFLSIFAALPCIGLLPCSPRQQFCTACWAFDWAQTLLVNLAVVCFSPFLLRHRTYLNWKAQTDFLFCNLFISPPTKQRQSLLCNLMSASFSAKVGLVFPLQTSIVGIKNLAISTLLN